MGLVSVQESFSINVRKEIESPEAFYSNVQILPKDYGFLTKLTAFAPTSKQAEEAGLVFLGRMLDVLSLKIDASLNVMESNVVIRNMNATRVKRTLGRELIRESFKESRELTLSQATYLRALGWFRKGKYTTDPLDKFLAFWIAIETVAAKYNPNKQVCSSRGSVCHIWECFKYIWGECCTWPEIAGKEDWIDTGNSKRVQIAHGTISTDVESVGSISSSIEQVERVSHRFLMDWRPVLQVDVDQSLMS